VVIFDVFLATTFTASALVSTPDLMANVFGDTSASLCLPGLFMKTVNRLRKFGYCCIQLEPAGRKIKWSACLHRLKPFFSPTGRALPLKAQSMGAVLKHAKVTGQAPRALKVNACLCHPSTELKTHRSQVLFPLPLCLLPPCRILQRLVTHKPTKDNNQCNKYKYTN